MKIVSRWGMLAVAAIALMMGAVAGSPSGVSAQTPGSVTVQAFICPEEYAGQGYDIDCDVLPEVEAYAYLDASEYGFTEMTGANGEAFFPELGIGEFVVELGVPGDFAGFYSFCGAFDETEPREVVGANTNRIQVELLEGDELYCSFYVSPVDARSDEPVYPAETDDVNTLPTTGVGSIGSGKSRNTTVFLLIGGVVLLAGLGLMTARDESLER